MSHVSSLSCVGLAAFVVILESSQWPIASAFHSNCSCLKVPAFCLSFHDGCIMSKLPVNLFLIIIICFYWKPHFLCCLPICEFGPDWALTTSLEQKASPAHDTGVSLSCHPGFMASHCHVRNEKDTVVWPLFGQCCEATGSFTRHEPEKCWACGPSRECHAGEF